MCHVSGPAEGLAAALHAAAVSAGLWCSQRVWVLPTTISLLSTLRAAVPPRRHDAGGDADRRCGCWHPYPGQTQRRGGALSEPTPPASPWIQEPGGRDPDDGQEGWGGGWRAVRGLDVQHGIPAWLTAACLMMWASWTVIMLVPTMYIYSFIVHFGYFSVTP